MKNKKQHDKQIILIETKFPLQNYERMDEKGLSVLSTIQYNSLDQLYFISEFGETHNTRDEITVYL